MGEITRVKRLSSREKAKVRIRLYERDGECCACCGAPRRLLGIPVVPNMDNLQIDHRLAIALGGTNDLSNLWLLCVGCHDIKTVDDMQRIRGYY